MNQYAEDLVEKAKKGELQAVAGRDAEVDQLIAALRRNENPCIIGEAGVGKTALVEGLAVLIAQGNVPDDIKDWRVMKVDFPSLIVGKGYGGDANGGLIRLRALFEYAKKHPDIVIFIDEVHQFGGYADLCKTFLDRGQIKLIGATTYDEFSVQIGRDPALERRFRKIFVTEPDLQMAFDIIKSKVPLLEQQFGVTISEEIMYLNTVLVSRYLPFSPHPDTEIKNLAAACEVAKREANLADKDKDKDKNEDKKSSISVTEAHVRQALTMKSNIPVNALTQQDAAQLLTMPIRFKKAIIGQDGAIDRVCGVIQRARLELNDPRSGRGVFLFAGPTGVGKSYLAKLLGAEIRQSLFIDAAQFDKDWRKKLISMVKVHPYCEIVFEGIERAKPEIRSAIMSMIDSGFMLDDSSRPVSFKNAVIILTSNTGRGAKTETEMRKVLTDTLGVEMVSKVDNLVFFSPLDENTAKTMVSTTVSNICSLIESKFGIKVTYGDDIVQLLIKKGLQLGEGAFGINKCIDRDVFSLLTESAMIGKIKPKQNIELKVVDDSIAFNEVKAPEDSKDNSNQPKPEK